jgi:hypothetical protein
MLTTNGRMLTMPKLPMVVASVFVSLFVLFIFPVAANAQATETVATPTQAPISVTPAPSTAPVPSTEPTPVPSKDGNVPNQTVPNNVYTPNDAVQAPGTPTATSPTDIKDIVWEWDPPVKGTTPDAPVQQPVETPTEDDTTTDPTTPVVVPPVAPQPQYPSDITHYGYELSEAGTVLQTGVVESSQNSVTTTVDKRGTYNFRLWSITRNAEISQSVTASQTVVNPPLPTVPPIAVPAALNTRPIDHIPSSNNTSSEQLVMYSGRTEPVSTATVASSNVLANANTDTTSETPTPQADVAAVVKTSDQGWIVAGLAWYIWILIAAILFTSWRWYLSAVKNRE